MLNMERTAFLVLHDALNHHPLLGYFFVPTKLDL